MPKRKTPATKRKVVAPAKARMGRPPYEPTAAERAKVEERVGSGVSTEDIAEQLGISRMTLRKHFATELRRGRLSKQGALLDILWREADRGAAWAVKELIRRNDQAIADARFGRQEATAPAKTSADQARAPKSERLGKKEERQAAADKIAAEGIYAVPSAPKLKLVANGD